jgi:DNA modification methylase
MTTKPFKGAHFAVFPPELPRTCVLAGCPEGGVVLDPFSGAATTGIVAAQLGRQYVGIELNPEYIELAYRRFEEINVADLDASLFIKEPAAA